MDSRINSGGANRATNIDPSTNAQATQKTESAEASKAQSSGGNITLSTIMAKFMMISDRMEDKLTETKEQLDALNKKVDTIKKDMNAASSNASDLSTRGDNKTANGVDSGKQATDWKDHKPDDIKYKDINGEEHTIKDNMQPPGELGKKGGEKGYTKEQWSSVNSQSQEQIKSIETQTKTIASDLNIEVQRWQSFSGQFLKAVEQMANDMQKIANSSQG